MSKEIKKISNFEWTLSGSNIERNYLMENLSMLLSAGLSVDLALDSILKELKNKLLVRIVNDIKIKIEEGKKLSEALELSGLFPNYAISLLKIGEESGNLVDNLKIIAEQQEKERSLRSKVRSAMLYPVLVFSMTVFIGIGVAWFILPRLAKVFSNLKIELPQITKALIYLGNFLQEHGLLAVPIFFLVLLFLIYFVFYFPKTNFIGQRILFTLPLSRKMIRQIEITRLCYILGTLLKSGLSILESTALLDEVSNFRIYKRYYLKLRVSFEEGNSFAKSFQKIPESKKLIPLPAQQMLIAAEQSGKLSDVMLLVSKNYEEKTETTTKNLTVLIEPLLLLVVWAGVVAVAIAVILPIYSLVGSINSKEKSSTIPPSVLPK